MYVARTFRMSAAAVAAVLAVGTVGTTAAEARPAPAPTGLAALVTAHANGSYDVAATWNATANASAYRVAISKGGATLATATVTTTSWSPTVTTTPGTASLSVRAVVTRKPGKVATISFALPDATPPTGAFHATWGNDGVATIAITTPVTDNSGGPVTATVDWGDGLPPESWDLTSDITHPYPLTAARYVPVVTLKDSSDNQNPVDVNAVVIDDTEDPTGSFTAGPATAWAKLTNVTLTQTAIDDIWSPDDKIARTVNWQDGSAPEEWTTGDTLTHTYPIAGDFAPTVTLTDEAGNTTDPITSTTTVHVTLDSTGPTVKLTLPRAKHSVKAWRTLRGKATDAGTGVKIVRLKAVEKRGGSWFGYNAVKGTWVKAGTKAKAFSRSKAFTLTTDARNRWSAKLVKLRRGTLVYKVRATDQVQNRSLIRTHKARLTRA